MARPHHARGLTGMVLLLIAGLTLTCSLWPPAASAQYATVIVPGRGDVFCPQTTLVLGSAVVPAGHCFKLAAFRDSAGSYLAFLPPTTPLVPRQVVSYAVGSPTGPYTPFLLLPVSASASLTPNTMTLVPARFEVRGGETRIVLLGGALSNTIVTVAQPAALPAPVAQPAAPPAAQAPGPVVTPAPSPVIVADEGQVFCPSADLISGNLVIPQGDCYRVALVRNPSGTFVAFVPQAIALPASRTVALSGPAMVAISRRAYLVPVSVNATIPMNTLVLVPSRISVVNGQEVVVLTGGPVANTIIRLDRRQ